MTESGRGLLCPQPPSTHAQELQGPPGLTLCLVTNVASSFAGSGRSKRTRGAFRDERRAGTGAGGCLVPPASPGGLELPLWAGSAGTRGAPCPGLQPKCAHPSGMGVDARWEMSLVSTPQLPVLTSLCPLAGCPGRSGGHRCQRAGWRAGRWQGHPTPCPHRGNPQLEPEAEAASLLVGPGLCATWGEGKWGAVETAACLGEHPQPWSSVGMRCARVWPCASSAGTTRTTRSRGAAGAQGAAGQFPWPQCVRARAWEGEPGPS